MDSQSGITIKNRKIGTQDTVSSFVETKPLKSSSITLYISVNERDIKKGNIYRLLIIVYNKMEISLNCPSSKSVLIIFTDLLHNPALCISQFQQ